MGLNAKSLILNLPIIRNKPSNLHKSWRVYTITKEAIPPSLFVREAHDAARRSLPSCRPVEQTTTLPTHTNCCVGRPPVGAARNAGLVPAPLTKTRLPCLVYRAARPRCHPPASWDAMADLSSCPCIHRSGSLDIIQTWEENRRMVSRISQGY